MQTVTEQFIDVLVDHPRKIILIDERGKWNASQIYNASQYILNDILSSRSFKGKRIAVFCRPGLSYTASMFAGWMSGAMMVPLCITHPKEELLYVLEDSGTELILADKELRELLPQSKVKTAFPDFNGTFTDTFPANYTTPFSTDPALMLYTSGTTGKPKGVVHSHASLSAQVNTLIHAWEWSENDHILHFLPLHHTHGIINKWLCALLSGATCEMMDRFDADTVWKRISSGRINLLMAVPTIYVKLIESFNQNHTANDELKNTLLQFRLMVSGSAALPVSVLEKWKAISGHVLLERYGMTETGMVLSNPYKGTRKPGTVGQVLPGMEVRLADEENKVNGTEGELQVRGANMFSGYWNRESETKKSFTKDGWFRTGDMVRLDDGYYVIAGRLSTDIIKSGGYKISALEIEAVLLTHPEVKECVVVGIADDTWGERIGAAVVWKNDPHELEIIRRWMSDKLAVYKLPSLLISVNEIPRNAMGKAVKQDVKRLF
jgi:malonyl-CoA/methylmalonyl-CoA synthetase